MDKIFSREQNSSEILNKNGHIVISIDESLITELLTWKRQEIDNKKLEDSDYDIIEKGYSIPLSIPEHLQKTLSILCKNLVESHLVRKYLRSPKYISSIATYSVYNATACKTPAHAHLWHRDLDDYGRQLKLMLPLVECDDINGLFSVLNSGVAPLHSNIIDCKLVETLKSNKMDDYRLQDQSRISDTAMRKNFSADIYDFRNKIGEGLLVDTNTCYHKGGLVTIPGSSRVLVQLTFGEITHVHSKSRIGNMLRKARLFKQKVKSKLFGRDIFLSN